MSENLTIGFIGNPNCGKTTLFNAYTGANLKVANWPGVTVEKVEGAIKDHDLNIRLVDLPGTYSLTSYTMEEQVSRQFILSDEVDVIIDVADASALERNLYLTLQLLELGKPVVLALNMMDIVEKRGMEIDTHRLPELLGIPVIPVSARKRTGLDVLLHAAAHHKDCKDPECLIHHHKYISKHRHNHHAEYAMVYIVYNLYLLSLNETKLLGSTMSSIIILLLNVICFKMFDKIAADAEIKRKNDIYKQSIDIYKREMEEREEHNEKLRRFRHDIKNHLIAIEKLALSKEYDRLRDYIHQLTDEKGVLQVTTISGNALIDGLLADKFDVARKYEIAVEYHIEIPTKLPFDDADLCIIVGNALDNAIDGTKDIEGAKKIEISMGFKQGNFLLKVKNTFNPELIKFDNNGKRLRTSKTDKSNHGMGIGLIEETALKYNGLMEITMNENLFCLSVLLYQN